MSMPSMSTALLLPALLIGMVAVAESVAVKVKPGCQASCGGVDIPYPFGIGKNCSRKGFEVSCVSDGSGDGPTPVLVGTANISRVVRLSVDPAESLVMLPVGWQCYDPSSDVPSRRTSITEMEHDGAHRISTRNMLVVVGCFTIGFRRSTRSNSSSNLNGCISLCASLESAQDGQCAGVGCCRVDIPPGLTDNNFFFLNLGGRSSMPTMMSYSPCDYAFLVDNSSYTFSRADLRMDKNRTTPVWLDWAIRDGSCADAAKPEYACKSPNSECVNSTNGPGYTCRCSQGYEGNAYVADGCTNINECARPEYPCYGSCRDTEGSYECSCRRGYYSKDAKTERCTTFPLGAQLAVGITLGISFLAVALLSTLMFIQKRRMNEFFKKNGGLTLQNVETLKIYTKEELNKITKNHSEVLGKGGFGQVYKGILPDNTTVAVKTSIEVNEARKEEFTKEVEIQSKMIHKNIIKLLGCCLEVDVPMLVYEFAANGSLHGILHGKTASHQLPLPLDLRLDIAIEAAEGLTYMHSSTSRTIRHGDVKPANILLDDKYMPKISDFGTSKLLTMEKDSTMLVVGSMGYIDPVFHKTGILTQKSDVYSFGVVLLELITRIPIVYDGNRSLIIEFLKVHEQDNSGRAMFDKAIATEENIFILEEIGRLAVQCLKERIEERPGMKEVAERLVMLRRARKRGQTNYTSTYQFSCELGTDGAPRSFASEISTTDGDTLPLIQN